MRKQSSPEWEKIFKKEDFIADLHLLKMELARGFSNNHDIVQPNVTYAVIETLIAVFLDKYKVKYEDVIKVLQERDLDKEVLKP